MALARAGHSMTCVFPGESSKQDATMAGEQHSGRPTACMGGPQRNTCGLLRALPAVASPQLFIESVRRTPLFNCDGLEHLPGLRNDSLPASWPLSNMLHASCLSPDSEMLHCYRRRGLGIQHHCRKESISCLSSSRWLETAPRRAAPPIVSTSKTLKAMTFPSWPDYEGVSLPTTLLTESPLILKHSRDNMCHGLLCLVRS